jgi:hypothetical protein
MQRTIKEIDTHIKLGLKPLRNLHTDDDAGQREIFDIVRSGMTKYEFKLFKAFKRLKDKAMEASFDNFKRICDKDPNMDYDEKRRLNGEHLNRNKVNDKRIWNACKKFTTLEQVGNYEQTDFNPEIGDTR